MRRLILLGTLALTACTPEPGQQAAIAQESPPEAAEVPAQDTAIAHLPSEQRKGPLTFNVVDEQGMTIGSVALLPADSSGVEFMIDVKGLKPGTHALALHSRARCEPPVFFSAGGHFDPSNSRHGRPDGDSDFHDPDHHAGDMTNQSVGDDGVLKAVIVNRSVSINAGLNDVLDEDGSALIIYEEADDYLTQPSGRAGSRIACAELISR